MSHERIIEGANVELRRQVAELQEQLHTAEETTEQLRGFVREYQEQLSAAENHIRITQEAGSLISDERDGLKEQLEAAQEALREIADSMGLEFFNAPEVARRALECVCGEINTRHCPVHGQDSNRSSLREQFEAERTARFALHASVLGLYDYAVDNGPPELKKAIEDILDAYPASSLTREAEDELHKSNPAEKP